ncbi:MAG: orotate phosphoribosyltransferase [Nitrospiria bacterium]
MPTTTKNHARLLTLLTERSFRYSKKPIYQLTSGKKTSYYIDCKKVALDAEGATLIGKEIFRHIKDLPATGVGGMTMGADPIATAVSLVSFLEGNPIPAFLVRKEPKGHGSNQQVEGPLTARSRLVVVEDVVTTAGSTLRTLDVLEKEGHTVLCVIALVDRLEGGRDRITRRGIAFESLFTMDDFVKSLSCP